MHIEFKVVASAFAFAFASLFIQYGTPENAADKPDGLAVLGVFIEVDFLSPAYYSDLVYDDHSYPR